MAAVHVRFTPAADQLTSRPGLPRSGACCVTLPSWHPHDVIMLGGYTEERIEQLSAAADAGLQPTPPPTLRRAVTMEAWTFSSADGGSWHSVAYAADGPMPQPRLTFQAAIVGGELWMLGGWDPSAPAGEQQFLNDVWALDLRTFRWRQVVVAGEELPRISRFALAQLPGGSLLLHTHRSMEDVLLLDTASAAASSSTAAATSEQPAAGPATLHRVPVHGVFPGGQSPPSRGLHSLTAAAAAPPAASSAAAAAAGKPITPGGDVPGTALYVFGGAPQSGPMYGDLWALDLSSMTWQELAPEGPKPHARCSHVAAACGVAAGGGAVEATAAAAAATADLPGRYLLIMGGSYYKQSGGLEPLDDVAVYDTQANRWVEVTVEGPRPRARNAAVMARLRPRLAADTAPVPGQGPTHEEGLHPTGGQVVDQFVLHGGWRPFVETFNDSFIVTVSTPACT